MPDTPKNQPSNVATEDALRPPDNAVVTSDTPKGAEPPGDGSGKPAAASDTDGPNDQDSAAGGSTKPKRNRTAERKIKKLSARLGAADETTTAQARRISELEGQVEELSAATPKAPEPKLKDFDTPQAYAKAYSKWSKAPAKPKASTTTPKPPPAKAADVTPIEDTDIADFTKRGKEKLGDEFVEATQDNDNAVNTTMGEYLLDHDLGPEIYVHLSNNHKDARKIFDMPPHKAVKALDDLAAKAKAGELDVGDGEMHVADRPDTGEPDNKPKKTPAGSGGRPGKTKAPEPPDDTKGGSATPKKSAEDEDMDEYAARRQQETRKAQGLPPL